MSIPKAKANLGPKIQPAATASPAPEPRHLTATASASVADSFVEQDETKLTIMLPRSLHRDFKAAAAGEGKKMRDIIETLLEEWTTEHLRSGR